MRFADEMYATMCVEWVSGHFDIVCFIDTLFTKLCANNDFYIFVPVTLTFDL